MSNTTARRDFLLLLRLSKLAPGLKLGSAGGNGAAGGEGRDEVSCFSPLRVHFATALVQILYAGFQVLASAALSDGVSRYVFPVYRNGIAFVLLAPIAFFLERKKRGPLTKWKLCQFFACALVGVCFNQTLYLAGLYYTSATFTSTVQNLVPGFTFGLAVCLGIEKIRILRREGQAKALGIFTCLAGAILISLYKGPAILTVQGTTVNDSFFSLVYSYSLSWQLGILCLLGNCITWAVWFTMQTPVLRDYDAPLSLIAFTYGFGTLQLAVIAVCVEQDLSAWASTFYSDLPTVFYGGVVASGLAMTLQGWCAHEGGPVLVAAYQPLQTVLVAILSSIFLMETFYLGSLIGGLLIFVGLYLVVWGKSRERRVDAMASESAIISNSDPGVINSSDVHDILVEPLLGNNNREAEP